MAATYVTTENKKEILFVLTSHSKLLGGKPTGWYLSEAAHPYYVLAPHFIIDWASPNGGKAPLDPASVAEAKSDQQCARFLKDEVAKQSGYENTLKLSDVSSKEYEAIFFVGGHGPMFDLIHHDVSIKLIESFWNEGKIVSAICHGPAALINAKDVNKQFILKGRKVTSFSNEEEAEMKLTESVPFLLETRLKEIGGLYARNDKVWGAYVTIDGQLILGANPASAETLGKALLAALKPNLDQGAIQERTIWLSDRIFRIKSFLFFLISNKYHISIDQSHVYDMESDATDGRHYLCFNPFDVIIFLIYQQIIQNDNTSPGQM